MRNIILSGIIFVSVSFTSTPTTAEVKIPDSVTEKLFTKTTFRCRVFSTLNTPPVEDFEKVFEVNIDGGSHGGESFSFSTARQTIVGNADGTWLAVAWSVDNKLVAKTVFAQSNSTVEHRALIVYHPDIEGAEASIDCSRLN